MKHFIIDGNNLIGKIPALSGLQKKDKQQVREKLVFLLQNYFSGKKIKLTLHLDGFENSPLKIYNGMIIYSNSTTADEKIKEQISKEKNRKNINVVSSDNAVKEFAKVCGCQMILSEEFAKLIKGKSSGDEEELRIKQMKNDVEEFKRLFEVGSDFKNQKDTNN
jgi:predicted RNA-binding protein with PIN domain